VQEEASIIPRTKSQRTTKKISPVSVIGYLRGRRAKELRLWNKRCVSTYSRKGKCVGYEQL